MKWRRTHTRLIVIGLTSAWVAACGSNPAGPSPNPAVSHAVSMTITGLSGPLNPGQAVPLTARVTLADGTQKIAADAQWQSADPTIVAVSANGVVKAVKAVGRGGTDVIATAGKTADIHVTVAAPSVRLTQTIDRHNSTAALSGHHERDVRPDDLDRRRPGVRPLVRRRHRRRERGGRGSQLGSRPFTGTVTEANDIELTLTDGTIQMVGYVQAALGYRAASMSLTMHGGSASGLLLVFNPSGGGY